jgi:hypothetical protein
VVRTPRGRKMTPAAWEHLGLRATPDPKQTGQQNLFE